MFPNLEAEMARKKIKKGDLQRVLEIRYATVVDKTNGKSKFTLEEAFKIKRSFFPEYSIDYLFSKEVDSIEFASNSSRH